MYLFPLMLSQLFNDTSENQRRNAYQVIDLDEEFKIKVSALGCEMTDLEVEVTDHVLTIITKAPQLDLPENAKVIWQEFILDESKLSFNLPNNVNIEDIKATLEKGQLLLTIPKVKPTKKSINIDVA